MSRRSRLRRKIRQQRANLQQAPATRVRTLTLDVLRDARRLRNEPLDRLLEQRQQQAREWNQTVIKLRRQARQGVPRSAVRRANRLVINNNNIGLTIGPKLGTMQVDLPHEHPICVQRRERRALMFATGKSGKGGQKTPRQPKLLVRCS